MTPSLLGPPMERNDRASARVAAGELIYRFPLWLPDA